MNLSTIEWRKQTPDELKISVPKKHSRYQPTRKTESIKQQQTWHNIESHPKGTVRSNKSLLEKPHTSLPPVNSIFQPALSSIDKIQPYYDKRLCSVRSGIIFFVVIIILILATGLAIGIVFASINARNSSGTQNSNQANSLSTISTVSTVSLTSSISIGSQTGPPCSAYTEINDPTRSISNIGSFASCDDGNIFNASNGGAWIRFVGSGGTKLPLSSPSENHCGAYLAGYYNGTLPTTPNVVTNGTVCFETSSGLCPISVDIVTVFCSTYYVFFLRPLKTCSARYCTT